MKNSIARSLSIFHILCTLLCVILFCNSSIQTLKAHSCIEEDEMIAWIAAMNHFRVWGGLPHEVSQERSLHLANFIEKLDTLTILYDKYITCNSAVQKVPIAEGVRQYFQDIHKAIQSMGREGRRIPTYLVADNEEHELKLKINFMLLYNHLNELALPYYEFRIEPLEVFTRALKAIHFIPFLSQFFSDEFSLEELFPEYSDFRLPYPEREFTKKYLDQKSITPLQEARIIAVKVLNDSIDRLNQRLEEESFYFASNRLKIKEKIKLFADYVKKSDDAKTIKELKLMFHELCRHDAIHDHSNPLSYLIKNPKSVEECQKAMDTIANADERTLRLYMGEE